MNLEERLTRSRSKKRKMKMGKKNYIVITSDYHVEFHDPVAIDCMLDVCDYIEDAYGLDEFIINGDFLDCYAISKFDKDPKRELEAQKEFDLGKDLLKTISKALPKKTKKWFLEGNHEYRFYKIKKIVRFLYSMRSFSTEEQLGIDEAGFNFLPYGKKLKYRQFDVHHGKVARNRSGYTGTGELEKSWRTAVTGHSHRGSLIYRTNESGEYMHAECFSLCDPEKAGEYIYGKPDWQQGFIVAIEDKKTGDVLFQPVHIKDGKCEFDGKVFG